MKSEPSSGDLGRRGVLRSILSKGAAFVGAIAAGAAGRSATAAAAEPAAPAMLKNIGVCCSDLEKSLLFYTEVFGFKADPEPQKIGPQLSGLLEVENLDLTIHFLNKQGVRLELLKFNAGHHGDGQRHPINTLGLSHLAFEVTNIKAMTEAVTHMGGHVIESTRLGSPDKTIAIFVTDPDGTRIELIAV